MAMSRKEAPFFVAKPTFYTFMTLKMGKSPIGVPFFLQNH